MPESAVLDRSRTAMVFRLALGAVAVAIGALPALAQTGILNARISTAIDKSRLGSARVGVSVLDCQSGTELASIKPGAAARGGDRDSAMSGPWGGGFIPASNMKLLTSGAALAVLGTGYEFKTEFVIDKQRLIVRGSGDPALADPELLAKMHMGVEQFVDRIVESIAKTSTGGLKEIVIDDRTFDREYVHADWPKEQLNRAYCAPVCGLNFHANILNVFVAPAARAGEAPIVRSEPSGPWLRIDGTRARTLPKGGKSEGTTEVWLERDRDPLAFRLHGAVRTALDAPIQVTVQEPSLVFGRVLADRLARAGVSGTGGPLAVRMCEPEEQLDVATDAPVAAIVRTPIAVVLERCNVDSDNLYAESLLKAIGHRMTGQPGSWSNGAAAVRMQLKEFIGGEMAAQLVMADGSGLSRNNRVSPEMLTRWLRAMCAPGSPEREAAAEGFVKSLALAGEEGTLRKRFRGSKLKNEVRAKSGYISRVRTLSGYVTNAATGRRVAFSVLVDELPPGSDQRAKELHENIVEIVDEWLASESRGASDRAMP